MVNLLQNFKSSTVSKYHTHVFLVNTHSSVTLSFVFKAYLSELAYLSCLWRRAGVWRVPSRHGHAARLGWIPAAGNGRGRVATATAAWGTRRVAWISHLQLNISLNNNKNSVVVWGAVAQQLRVVRFFVLIMRANPHILAGAQSLLAIIRPSIV